MLVYVAKIWYKESLTNIILVIMKKIFFNLAMALIVLVSPVFIKEEMSIWNIPYVIYFFCLLMTACAPFLSINTKDPKDNLFILGINMVLMVILAIPAAFSCYREIHFVFLSIGGIGAAISFGVSMLRIHLQKKYHRA